MEGLFVSPILEGPKSRALAYVETLHSSNHIGQSLLPQSASPPADGTNMSSEELSDSSSPPIGFKTATATASVASVGAVDVHSSQSSATDSGLASICPSIGGNSPLVVLTDRRARGVRRGSQASSGFQTSLTDNLATIAVTSASKDTTTSTNIVVDPSRQSVRQLEAASKLSPTRMATVVTDTSSAAPVFTVRSRTKANPLSEGYERHPSHDSDMVGLGASKTLTTPHDEMPVVQKRIGSIRSRSHIG
ncbi:unnamed protein product [Protopolystoma xenopodis]|uniref:Uncharacterized protein n=1 Tax=Protopolystoma xenopodis TaxID=117903 RepID=A0A448WLJ1_9PLAT|nr:unnamed protein product [Protopolystoma xenopodis]